MKQMENQMEATLYTYIYIYRIIWYFPCIGGTPSEDPNLLQALLLVGTPFRVCLGPPKHLNISAPKNGLKDYYSTHLGV